MNNKARRAAKAKARAKQRTAGPHGRQPEDAFGDPFRGLFEPPRSVGPEARWHSLEQAAHRNDEAELARLAQRMVRDDPSAGPLAAERILMLYVDGLWQHGWQPAEVVRQVRRKATKAAAQTVELAIHADHARRSGQVLDPRWAAQVDELGGRTASTRPGWLATWRDRHGHAEEWAIVQVAKALAALGYLPVVDLLIPPPGRPGLADLLGVPRDSGTDDPVLRRVRKLLAKAESTAFDHEAESLTAKAHQLMTKHAIDQALLHQTEPSDVPCTIRVAVDAPYADGKSYLLQVVASGTRCRAIFHPGLDLSSVLGHAADLRAVELLYFSLLVQAQNSLAAAGGRTGARGRGQAYRSAFYRAFAARISERLRAATAEVFAEAGEGAHLPVLLVREQAVEGAFDARYGETMVSSAVRGGWDPLGAAHGQQAADAARFGADALAT